MSYRHKEGAMTRKLSEIWGFCLTEFNGGRIDPDFPALIFHHVRSGGKKPSGTSSLPLALVQLKTQSFYRILVTGSTTRISLLVAAFFLSCT